MTQTIEIRVPDIGNVADIAIVELPLKPGDLIKPEDTVAVLESDKATLDVPSPYSGRVSAIKVAVGDRVSEGHVLLLLELPDEIAAAAGETAVPPASVPVSPAVIPMPPPSPPPASAPAQITPVASPLAHASPSMRRYARTLGVILANLSGTGPKGRITREDIEAHVKARLEAPATACGDIPSGNALAGLPDWPRVDHAKFGPVERMKLGRIARISGPALARNAMLIPHVTNFDKADVTDLEAFRKAANAEADQPKLTMLAFTVKAVVATLKAFPHFNSVLEGDELVLRKYWNIGVAADTPQGLMVPVIKEADRKSLREIAAEMAGLAASARSGKLKPADMQGAGFSISSLGGIGGTGFTPIINAPEVAILGLTRAEIQPVWDGSGFQPRLVQPLCLSWDHRVVDGVAAARFLAHLSAILADFRRISL